MEIEPHEADQKPLGFAWNCWVAPSLTVAVAGEIGRLLAMPVPESPTVSGDTGLPVAVMLHEAVSAFPVEGVKTRDAAQLVEGARLDPHVVDVTAKSPAFAPETPPGPSVTELDNVFATVMVCEELGEPWFTAPKDNVLGDAVRVPPVPESATVRGVGLPLLVMLQVALSVDGVVGVKVMFAVQLAEAAMLEPQVVEATAKSPA